jgi:hypothetical protein
MDRFGFLMQVNLASTLQALSNHFISDGLASPA